MPNWTPGDNAMSEFNSAIRRLLQIRVAIMELDFPLTVEQIEACTTPDVIRGYYEAIRKAGITSVKKNKTIGFVLTPDHGTSRRIAVKCFLPRNIYYSYDEQIDEMYMRGAIVRGDVSKLPFDPMPIKPELLVKLVTWTENVTQEKRRAELTDRTVKAFINAIQKDPTINKMSLAHMIARWPALRTVCSHIESTYRMQSSWQEHVRELPSDLHRYRWPAWGDTAIWRHQHVKQMQLAEEVLISAVTLTRPTSNPAVVRAEVVEWEKLNGQTI